MGRPSKYKEEYCDMLIKHLAKGYPIETFAAEINVNPDTIYEWANRHPEFSEAKKIGLAHCIKFYIDMFHENKLTTKGSSFQQACWIFTMRNIAKWTDKVEVTSDKNNPIVINYDPRTK